MMTSTFIYGILLIALCHLVSCKPCDPGSCQLPSCYCGHPVPGNIVPDLTPMFVLLSFDDAVNDLNKDFYQRLFSRNRTNPNGCPITATFFVSHEWTDYRQVHHLYKQGHEISSHSVTHTHPSSFDDNRWASEVAGQAELLSKLGNIPSADIVGFRAPFLETAGDGLYRALKQYNFLYDSSLPTELRSPALWPYTLHNGVIHSCSLPPCPTESHPGVWEVPMTTMLDSRGGRCAMLDGCQYDEDIESIQRMLTRNFLRHYTDSNKAPFPMSYHAAWFSGRPHREEALFRFIDSVLELPDVYFVTYQEMLKWTQSPVSVDSYATRHTCSTRDGKRDQCKARVCNYGSRTLVTCTECPDKYPWI